MIEGGEGIDWATAEALDAWEPRFDLTRVQIGAASAGVIELDLEGFRETFRKSPVKRAKFDGFMRNVRIALKNWEEGMRE